MDDGQRIVGIPARRRRRGLLAGIPAALLVAAARAAERRHADERPLDAQPRSRSERPGEGWTLRIDDRLLPGGDDAVLGAEVLRRVAAKLADIATVVPDGPLARLREVPIVIDVACGDLRSMQYHPSVEWLEAHGYPAALVKCVHVPIAAQIVTPTTAREQPWVLLHELAHAYHDRVLSFDEPRIRGAFDRFVASGRGERTLLFDGSRTRHYALTDPKEFFAEMTEAWFGSNDFHPFNRAELLEGEPEIAALMAAIWGEPRR